MCLRIYELRHDQCRFVLNDRAPFFCCGEPVRDQSVSYCSAHAERCFTGPGRDWRNLADMIDAVEQTVVRT